MSCLTNFRGIMGQHIHESLVRFTMQLQVKIYLAFNKKRKIVYPEEPFQKYPILCVVDSGKSALT